MDSREPHDPQNMTFELRDAFAEAATNYFTDEASVKAGIQLQKDAYNMALDKVIAFINKRNIVQVDELKAFKE